MVGLRKSLELPVRESRAVELLFPATCFREAFFSGTSNHFMERIENYM
jgi:hypothetical protein